MENVEYKFQILFVFGQSYMSKDAAKNLTKEWQLENKEHHDLIIAGIYCLSFYTGCLTLKCAIVNGSEG